uniref:Uncharacterized protein n=1 Tax=Meloidogyne enterolobii TaxID=390850 RepID=A0A6V7XDZ2_MELEN|nr:unnamed protein product [Meloidogyne enterolobii]
MCNLITEKYLSNYRRDCFICIKRTFDYLLDNEPRCYILKLPTFPENFEQKIIRYCLEQLFNCIFEYALFGEIVFNPEMINLLFDNDKAINIQTPYLFPSGNERFDNIWNFVSNHLTTSKCLIINVDNIHSLYAERKLFNILTTEGSKLPEIKLINVRVKWLYNAIVEHITTSKDLSKVVDNISLQFSSPPKFELSNKAEMVEIKQLDGFKYTKLQIFNIHNTRVRFTVCTDEFLFVLESEKLKSRIRAELRSASYKNK